VQDQNAGEIFRTHNGGKDGKLWRVCTESQCRHGSFGFRYQSCSGRALDGVYAATMAEQLQKISPSDGIVKTLNRSPSIRKIRMWSMQEPGTWREDQRCGANWQHINKA